MKILVAGVRWPAETFIMQRLAALAEAGFEVVVATTSGGAGAGSANPRWVRLPRWNEPNRLARLCRLASAAAKAALSPAAALRLARAARSESSGVADLARWLNRLLPFARLRADVIHFEWNFAAADYLPLFDLSGCPCVVSCRGSHLQVGLNNPARRHYAPAVRRTFQKAAAVHCVSKAILREAMRYGLDPAKAWIIPPAVDARSFRPPAEPRAAGPVLQIAAVGGLHWVKGYEYALMAVQRLKSRGWNPRLIIVGDGEKTERQRVLFAIHDLGLENEVLLRGAQPPAEVRRVLQESDVFLHSSVSEGISNAVLEAMACGLPVVTTDCGGMGECVTNGVEGFVTPVRDAEAAAAALERLAARRELRLCMGKAARQRVLGDFTLERQTQRFVSLYRSVAGAPALPLRSQLAS